MACDTKRVLANAFRDVALGLVGVLDAFDARPELGQAVADVLRKAYLVRTPSTPRTAARSASGPMKAFLEEIAGDAGPSTCSCRK